MIPYDIVRLEPPADAPRLQRLLEQCSDYYVLHEGCPTPKDAGEYELSAVPDGWSPDDLHVLGMASPAGELVAVAQVLPDYPRAGAWWIALLVVAPGCRGRGLGSHLLEYVANLARVRHGQSLELAVSVNNPRGHAFWQAAGFRDTEQRLPVTARSGHVETARIMIRDLGAA